MSDRTPNRQRCPLCTEVYDDRTDLRVHLEVEHRKSEIVAEFVDRCDVVDDGGEEATVTEPERSAPSAD